MRRPRRRLIWARTDFAVSPAQPDLAVDLLLDFRATMGLGANLPGTTVKRIRGAIQWNPSSTTPGPSLGSLVGIYKDDLSTATANVSRPSVSPHLDWMLFDWVPATMAWSGGAEVGGDFYGYAIDARSQRRLDEPQETLWLVSEQTADADTAGLYGWVSVLLALP